MSSTQKGNAWHPVKDYNARKQENTNLNEEKNQPIKSGPELTQALEGQHSRHNRISYFQKLSRVREDRKKTQTKLLEMKTAMSKRKNTLEGIMGRSGLQKEILLN